MTLRNLHWASLGANFVMLAISIWYGLGLLAGWAIINCAVSSSALRSGKRAS